MARYTSLEMRYMANAIRGQYGDNSEFTDAIAMLYQAAALQEREEREKKFEYSFRRFDQKMKCDTVDMLHCETLDGARELHCTFYRPTNGVIVRREVGEWEEVQE